MKTTFEFPDDAPRLDQYSGVWAIEPAAADMLLAHVEGVDLHLHVTKQLEAKQKHQAAAGDRGGQARPYELTRDGVAVIGVDGPMTKYGSSLFSGASSLMLRRAVNDAVAEDQVRGVLLVIDSPGGSVAGVDELGRAVLAARGTKPVWAAIDDLGASAAYWVAAQADRIYATRSSAVGSIGVYTVIQDFSASDEKSGRKVHVVKFGANKAIGAGGPVTDEQLAEMQRLIDARGEQFIAAVAEGRKAPIQNVRGWADGRVELGPAALEQGLIDAIGHHDQALAELTEHIRGSSRTSARGTKMAADTPVADAPKAATIAELEKAMPNAGGGFVLNQLKAGATLTEALGAYVGVLEADNAKLNADLATQIKATEEATKLAADKKTSGNKPLGEGGGDEASWSGDAKAEWHSQLAALQAAGMSRPKAVAQLQKNKALYAAFMAHKD